RARATGATAARRPPPPTPGRLSGVREAPPRFLFSYHWLGAEGDRFVVFEGARTRLMEVVDPNETVAVAARVRPPRQPGRYRLEWDLVQEGRLWFSTEPGASHQITRVSVTGEAVERPALASIAPPKPTVRPGRFELWRAAARMIAAHPFVGVGPDNFRLAYGSYAGLAFADTRTHSNNMYLEVLAGRGLLAFAACAWLLWRATGCVAQGLRLAADRGNAVVAGVAAAAAAIALHATVDSFVSFAPTYVLFSLTLGYAVACANGVESRLDAHRVCRHRAQAGTDRCRLLHRAPAAPPRADRDQRRADRRVQPGDRHDRAAAAARPCGDSGAARPPARLDADARVDDAAAGGRRRRAFHQR